MRKRVLTSDLRPGMYIADLNAGWLDHPFLRNHFLIKDQETITQIQKAGIANVYVNVRRGLDVDAPTVDDVMANDDAELNKLIEADHPGPLVEPTPASPHRLQRRAKIIVTHAVNAVRFVMTDVRMGKPLDLARIEPIAETVAVAVANNPRVLTAVSGLHRECDYTYAHSVRVGVLLASTGHQMGLSEEACSHLALGGMIHDLGKTLVDRNILRKPCRLNDDEMAHMREHVALGLGQINTSTLPELALQVLAHHHERHDGRGYPLGLCGDEIPLAGRMAAVADVYDAISSDRWYHKGISPPQAIRKIFEWRDHLDNRVVEYFIRTVGVYPAGSLVRLSDQRLAIVSGHSSQNLLRPCVIPIFDTRQKRNIPAEELNLSEIMNHSIVGFEDPDTWGITPEDYFNAEI